MLEKKIKYVDYNGIEREEVFRFNLNKQELMKMQLTTEGGFAEKIQSVVESKDTKAIIEIFENLILASYGVKSDDGKRFMKSEELKQAFKESEAYNELFMELATDPDSAQKFIMSIVPEISEAEKAQTKAFIESK